MTKSCYDLAGDLRSTTAPKGSSGLSSCPDPAADPYVYTTASYTTKLEYDAAHRLVETTDPAGETTETGYDENGQVTSETDELGKVTTTTYGDRGERVSLEQPYDTGRTIATRWEYDALGNVERLISPRAFDAASGGPTFTDYVESYGYDALGRLVKTTLPAATGTTQAFLHNAYDPDGRLLWTSLPTTAATAGAVTDAEKTQNTYWDTGAIYSQREPALAKQRFDYSAEGWQTSRIPEVIGQPGVLDLARSMFWDYTPDGLVSALLDDGGERATYDYDANGNLTSAVEATGLTTSGQTPLPVELSYDSLDQQSEVRVPKPGSANWLATVYSYDLHGNRASEEANREETTGGSTVTAGRVSTFAYDQLDRATSQVDDFATGGTTDDEQLLYTYTDRSELASQTLQKGGAGSWVTEQSSERTYFDNGLLKTLTNKNAAGAMVEQHALNYVAGGVFANGNRVSDVLQLRGPDAGASCYSATCTATWTYDARDRLTAENTGAGLSTTYALDVAGNVTTETPTPGAAITRTYTGLRLSTQAQSGTTVKFLYDGYGNQDCKVKSSYAGSTCPGSGSDLLEDWSYDYKSRLASYRSFNGSGGLVNSVSWTSDPLDRPVAQSSTVSGSTTNYAFGYVGASDLLSLETLTGATSATRKYGYDAFGRRATIADNTNRYSYLYDAHGSVSLLVDYAGSNPTKASYGYTAYGSPVTGLTKTAAGFNATVNAYRYTGKRADAGSGTLDMGARRYTPGTGRFLQFDQYDGVVDNLGLSLDSLTQNRYALAGGDPVTFVETDGHYFARDTTANGIPSGAPPRTSTAQVPTSSAQPERAGGSGSGGGQTVKAPVGGSSKKSGLGATECAAGMHAVQIGKDSQLPLCYLPKAPSRISIPFDGARPTPRVSLGPSGVAITWQARRRNNPTGNDGHGGGSDGTPIIAPKIKKPGGAAKTSDEAGALVKYDPMAASRNILGQVGDGYAVTPGGRTVSAHAAERIVFGGPGRSPTTLARVDNILNKPTGIKYDPVRDTVKVMQGKDFVVVSGTGRQHIVTVMIR